MKAMDWLRGDSGSLRWGLLLLIVAGSAFVAAGIPLGPVTFFGSIIAVLFAYAYPYVAFALMVGLIPFLGLFVHIPASSLPLGSQLFGGSIDMLFGEVIAIAVMAAWALKILLLWFKRNDVNWKPWFPLFWPMMAIVATHVISMFSVFQPDALLVIKYAIRPVLWSYLLYIALTVNIIRSKRRLKMVLAVLVGTGIFASVLGFLSLWFAQDPGQIFPRAKPIALFGLYPLGENHNLLAEWLSVTVPYTFALALFIRSAKTKRLLFFAAGFQILIALMTFARSLWIVFAFEALFFGWLMWRKKIAEYIPQIVLGLVLLLPLGFLMALFSSSALVASSTSTRVMMTEIAMNTWAQSPWIGAGAGTFEDRIGQTALFVIEFGTPLDSHGWIQKLFAEVGLIGFLAVVWFFYVAYRFLRRSWGVLFLRAPLNQRMLMAIFVVAASGAIVYQLFNTSYWSGKLWLPIGLLFAVTRVFDSSADS